MLKTKAVHRVKVLLEAAGVANYADVDFNVLGRKHGEDICDLCGTSIKDGFSIEVVGKTNNQTFLIGGICLLRIRQENHQLDHSINEYLGSQSTAVLVRSQLRANGLSDEHFASMLRYLRGRIEGKLDLDQIFTQCSLCNKPEAGYIISFSNKGNKRFRTTMGVDWDCLQNLVENQMIIEDLDITG